MSTRPNYCANSKSDATPPPFVYIDETSIRDLLTWTSVVTAVEAALVSVAKKRAIQPARTFTPVAESDGVLLSMPGFYRMDNQAVLSCKLVTAFKGNEQKSPPLPTILGNIFLFNHETGKLKAVVEGTEITTWRTAAASVVATKHLHLRNPGRKCEILGILGAGTQGRIHAIAFHHIFHFKKVHIWNHRPPKAEKLVTELKALGIDAVRYDSAEECVQEADVVVTATSTSTPILQLAWLKPTVHINAIGAGVSHASELSRDIYRKAKIFLDSEINAKVELADLYDTGIVPVAEIGEVITGSFPTPHEAEMTVFQSLGMAVEDGAVANMIYDLYTAKGKM